MNIEISARHFDLTEALRDHITRKLSTLQKFYDGVDDVQVILELSKGISSTHVSFRGDQLRLDAKDRGHDMYATFDACVVSLEAQIRRFKERRHNHPHRPNGEGSEGITLYEPAVPSQLGDTIRVENHVKLPTLTTNQAMTELEVQGLDRFVFHNEETGAISAAYRTESGITQVVELRKIG